MRRVRSLRAAQRVVLVVALGAALVAVGDYVTTLGRFTGWTGYAPLATGAPPVGGLHPWLRLLVWLALVLAWAVCSVALLGAGRAGPEPAADRAENGPVAHPRTGLD